MYRIQRTETVITKTIVNDAAAGGNSGKATNWNNVQNRITDRIIASPYKAVTYKHNLRPPQCDISMGSMFNFGGDEQDSFRSSYSSSSDVLSSTPILGHSISSRKSYPRVSEIPKRTPLRLNLSLMNNTTKRKSDSNEVIPLKKAKGDDKEKSVIVSQDYVTPPNQCKPIKSAVSAKMGMDLDHLSYLKFGCFDSPYHSPYTPNTICNLDKQKSMYATRMTIYDQSRFRQTMGNASTQTFANKEQHSLEMARKSMNEHEHELSVFYEKPVSFLPATTELDGLNSVSTKAHNLSNQHLEQISEKMLSKQSQYIDLQKIDNIHEHSTEMEEKDHMSKDLVDEEMEDGSKGFVEEMEDGSNGFVEEIVDEPKSPMEKEMENKPQSFVEEMDDGSKGLVEEIVDEPKSFVEKSMENKPQSFVEEGKDGSKSLVEEIVEEPKSFVEKELENKPQSFIEEMEDEPKSLVEEQQLIQQVFRSDISNKSIKNQSSLYNRSANFSNSSQLSSLKQSMLSGIRQIQNHSRSSPLITEIKPRYNNPLGLAYSFTDDDDDDNDVDFHDNDFFQLSQSKKEIRQPSLLYKSKVSKDLPSIRSYVSVDRSPFQCSNLSSESEDEPERKSSSMRSSMHRSNRKSVSFSSSNRSSHAVNDSDGENELCTSSEEPIQTSKDDQSIESDVSDYDRSPFQCSNLSSESENEPEQTSSKRSSMHQSNTKSFSISNSHRSSHAVNDSEGENKLSTFYSTDDEEPIQIVRKKTSKKLHRSSLVIRPEVNNNDSQRYNIRRSKRNRVRPTHFWAGERPVYNMIYRKGNLVPTLVGVTHEKLERPRIVNRTRRVTKPEKKLTTLIEPCTEEEERKTKDIFNLSVHDKLIEKDLPSLEEDTNDLKHFKLMSKIKWNELKSSQCVYQSLLHSDRNHAWGKLKFGPSAHKTRASPSSFSAQFNIQYGKILLLLFETDKDKVPSKKRVLNSGDGFLLEKGSSYELHNLRNDEAYVDFTIFKQKD